jgi:hypothetical protein
VRLIGPATFLLGGGQVLPFALLAAWPRLGTLAAGLSLAACAAAYDPRMVGVWRFGQPVAGAVLHPVGVALLLVVQWYALVCRLLGRPVAWKGRGYGRRCDQPARVGVR